MIEKYVVSLDLAKKLKEAGWNKPKLHFWVKGEIGNPFVVDYELAKSFEILAPAPLAEEILEELPKRITKPMVTYWLDISFIKRSNIVKYIEYDWLHILIDKEAPKLSDALAQLWLWLKEHGYLEEKL